MTPADLRRRRERMDLTQSDLATAFGLSRAAINNYECGRHPMPGWIEWAIRGLEAARLV